MGYIFVAINFFVEPPIFLTIPQLMIDRATFESIKSNHGRYASWAVWADEGATPTSGVGDLSVFDLERNPVLLNQLNPSVVLVGLNISRPLEMQLGNFHDRRRQSKDFKIRFALKDTRLWGAYLTDAIKDFEQKASSEMMAYLRGNRDFEKRNLELFEEELRDLGVSRPELIAFGKDAFRVLERNLGSKYNISMLPHYSIYGSKESYREKVKETMRKD